MHQEKADPDKYESFVNEKARVSFYGDFLYPLAADSTFEQYQKEKPEGEILHRAFYLQRKNMEGIKSFSDEADLPFSCRIYPLWDNERAACSDDRRSNRL